MLKKPNTILQVIVMLQLAAQISITSPRSARVTELVAGTTRERGKFADAHAGVLAKKSSDRGQRAWKQPCKVRDSTATVAISAALPQPHDTLSMHGDTLARLATASCHFGQQLAPYQPIPPTAIRCIYIYTSRYSQTTSTLRRRLSCQLPPILC